MKSHEKIDELDKLVTLAEDVALKVEKLREKRITLFVQFTTSLIIFYIVFAALALTSKNYLQEFFNVSSSFGVSTIAVTFLAAISLIYFLMNVINRYWLIKKEFRIESEILKELLSMIFEFKKYNNLDSENLELISLDIRLKRIKFSAKK